MQIVAENKYELIRRAIKWGSAALPRVARSNNSNNDIMKIYN